MVAQHVTASRMTSTLDKLCTFDQSYLTLGTLADFYDRRKSQVPVQKKDMPGMSAEKKQQQTQLLRGFHVRGTSESRDFLFNSRECNIWLMTGHADLTL